MTNSIPNIASNAKPAHLLYAIKTMFFIALYPILFNGSVARPPTNRAVKTAATTAKMRYIIFIGCCFH
jgi:hypothetical protein